MNNWINKIVKVKGVNYLISKEEINVGDLITNEIVVVRYDDSHSLLGFRKIIATEDEIGFIQLQSNVRLFETEEQPEVEYVPLTKRWMDAILGRNGICSVEGVLENKLVINF